MQIIVNNLEIIFIEDKIIPDLTVSTSPVILLKVEELNKASLSEVVPK